MKKAITLTGLIYRITTTVDGGWRVTFDFPESEFKAVLQISANKNKTLALAIVEVDDSKEKKLLSFLDED